jgi:CelD/BcsL family acetyltransferase involved in cellulose biosynthesis
MTVAPQRLQIARITDPRELDSLAGEWRSLVNTSDRNSIFVTYEWQSQWWKHYGANGELAILTARADGQLVGILPAYIQKQRLRGGLTARVLRFIGTGGDTSPDYLDAILADSHAPAAAIEFARTLLEWNGWDILKLTDSDESSPLRHALTEAAARAGLPCESELSARISIAHLPKTFDEYLAGMSGDRRYTVRNTRRKFAALPGARFTIHQDPATLDQAIDRLIELHHLRWGPRDPDHAFATNEYVAFHRAIMHDCMRNGWLRLCALETEGRTIAMYYCYAYRGTWYYFQSGFDPAVERVRPGLVLMGHMFEAAINENSTVFDMLRGEYDFKKVWAKQIRETHGVTIRRTTLQGRAWQLFTRDLPRWKRSVLARLGRK